MFILISGAAASGKKTIARALAERLPALEAHHDNERVSRNAEERRSNLEAWIEDALRLEAEGIDLVLASQSPLGEILASPRAVELEGIAPCLLDSHDFVRLDRWRQRGIHPDWPVGMDHFCWAVFHRMHARDPQWEQRVLVDRESSRSGWSRWTGWIRDDPRWKVLIHDSSGEDVETTIQAVTVWVQSVRKDGPPLRRVDEWWKA
jgi:hypothetical protein